MFDGAARRLALRAALAGLALAAPLAPGCAAPLTPEAAEAEVRAAAAEMLRLAEARKYRTLYEQFADPDVVNRAAARGELDEELARFESGAAEHLTTKLREAQTQRPELDLARWEARFPADAQGAGLTFRKVGRRWYLVNASGAPPPGPLTLEGGTAVSRPPPAGSSAPAGTAAPSASAAPSP